MKKQREEITIKYLIDIFLPKIWIIAVVSILFGALLGGYSIFIQEDQYTSKASFVMVKVPTKYSDEGATTAVNTGLNQNEILAMQNMIGMSEQILKTTAFAINIKEHLVEINPEYENVKIEQIKSMLSIDLQGDGTFFTLSAVSTDSRLAYDVADVVYTILPDEIEEVFDRYAISVKDIDPPLLASSPNSKNVIRNTLIGLVGGMLLSMLVVLIITKVDVVVRSKEHIENNFEIPIIGIIPRKELDD